MYKFFLLILFVFFNANNAYSADLPKPESAVMQKKYQSWYKVIKKNIPSKVGCFQAEYPSKTYKEIKCLAKSIKSKPYARIRTSPTGELSVGNNIDYSITHEAASILIATGKFSEYIAPNIPSPLRYSLQLNTNFNGTTEACSGGGPKCTVWQQFIYSSQGNLFIEYWLLRYGTNCPSGWFSDGLVSCVKDSNMVNIPVPISYKDLGKVQLQGSVNGTTDSVALYYGNQSFLLNAPSTILNIRKVWQDAEYNIFGDGSDSPNFNFSPNTIMTVTLDAGINSMIDTSDCKRIGTTAETNNLNLGKCIASPSGSKSRYIIFDQSNVN